MEIKKFILPGIVAIAGICAAIMVVSIITSAPSGKSPEQVQEEQKSPSAPLEDNLATERLQFQALEQRILATETNIQKIYANQVELSKSIGDLLKNEEFTKKTHKENRAYIAMLYQKVLDLELRTENIGGGFNNKRRPSTQTQNSSMDSVNPLSGTETLPSPDMSGSGVLPPLPTYALPPQ